MTTDADRRALACLDLLLSAIGSQRADHYMDAYNTVRAALAGREQTIKTPDGEETEYTSKLQQAIGNGGVLGNVCRQQSGSPAQQQNSGGSFLLASKGKCECCGGEGDRWNKNGFLCCFVCRPESRPNAPCETVEGLDEAVKFFDGFNELLEPHKKLVEAAKLQLKRQNKK